MSEMLKTEMHKRAEMCKNEEAEGLGIHFVTS